MGNLRRLAVLAALMLAGGGAVAETVSGKITEANTGRGVSRISVVLQPHDEKTAREVVTNADGNYLFRSVPPGRYVLSVRDYLARYQPHSPAAVDGALPASQSGCG